MNTQIRLGNLPVDVVKKDIKNVHLSVYPPKGKVRIAAPLRMSLDTIRVFAISKLGWIKGQQQILRGQERETPREYIDRESHYLWGRRYLLKVMEDARTASIEISHNRILLRLKPGTSRAKRLEIMEEWYRQQMRNAMPAPIAKWGRHLGVKPNHVFVQRMKTKWGSCNFDAKNIRLNTDLAKKPVECLEYIIVHELAHLLERRHNERFVEILDRVFPKWQSCRDELNRAPLTHETWKY